MVSRPVKFLERIPVLRSVSHRIQRYFEKKERNKYLRRGYDPNRVRGDRPYENMVTVNLKKEYSHTIRWIRSSGRTPPAPVFLDRANLYREELRERGIDPDDVYDPGTVFQDNDSNS